MRFFTLLTLIAIIGGCRIPRKPSVSDRDTTEIVERITYDNDETVSWDGYSTMETADTSPDHCCGDVIVDAVIGGAVDSV